MPGFLIVLTLAAFSLATRPAPHQPHIMWGNVGYFPGTCKLALWKKTPEILGFHGTHGYCLELGMAEGVGVGLSYNPLSSNGFFAGLFASPTLCPTPPTGTWRTSQAESAPYRDSAGKAGPTACQSCPAPA